MADTATSSSQRTDATSHAGELYDNAVEMPFAAEPATGSEAPADASTPADAPALAEGDATRAEGAPPASLATEKAKIAHMGKASILRIEHLRAENVELKAEGNRLRKELTRLRERNTALERTNYTLDEKVSELNAARKQIVELERAVEYNSVTRRAMADELRQLQDSLADAEKSFAQTESQLRMICQERTDRISGLTEELRNLQRSKAELEQQVETLLGYRQRAMACLQQLTDELKRLRKENREKSRRLSETQAILQSIDQRLEESIVDPT